GLCGLLLYNYYYGRDE
nr:immunoglobulin heavy chain junction region [Mus musculus]